MSDTRNAGAGAQAGGDAQAGAGAQGLPVAPQKKMTPFDEIYDRPDPRDYFRALGSYGYRTPHHARAVFRRMVEARRKSGPVPVLDICCSYGINAALLNHDVTLDDLYAHYACAGATALTTAQLIERDRDFYRAHRRPDAVPVIGLDVAANAIGYARAVGLLDEGFAENLELSPPSPPLLRATRHVRLITITGGASFLSPRTFGPLLNNADAPVWVAAFVLRTGSYRPIANGLARHGLLTERAGALTFTQRRFTGDRERQYAINAVTATGEDPLGKETEGHFHTALHLSRPRPDTLAFPLAELMPGAS